MRSESGRGRLDAIAIAALFTVVATIGAWFALDQMRGARLAEDRRAIRIYAETISPLAFEGGRIIQQRIKPALGDLVDGKLTPQDFRRQAAAWKHDLEEIRKAFAAASVPARVASAGRIFDRSLRDYVAAVDEFVRVAATKGTPEQIDAALEPGRVIARRADQTYDQARRLVQAELARVGLPESTFA